MDTPSVDTFQLLLDEIKKMNVNLEAASFAINDLTMQLHKSSDTIRPPVVNDNKTNTAEATPCIDTSAHGDQIIPLGYANWDESHDKILEKQNLVQMVVIRAALKKLRTISIANMKPTTTNDKQFAKHLDYDEDEEYSDEEEKPTTRKGNKGENDLFSFKQSTPCVGKENRFPQDAVYVDVNSPRVKLEMDFMNKLFVPPTAGVVERFMSILESEMQTCGSFEKKYGLKWV